MQIQPNLPSQVQKLEMEAVFHKGETLPVKVSASGDILKMSDVDTKVELAKTIYLKMGPGNDEPLFKYNPDDSWKSFTEAFTGNLGAAIETSPHAAAPLVGALHLELNQRV